MYAIGEINLSGGVRAMIDEKSKQRNQLHELLGDMPGMQGPVEARALSTTEHESYYIERLELDLNGIEAVPAYFIRPKKSEGKPFPVILFNHSHGGIYEVGKDELLRDKGYLQLPNYAEFLTSLGYAVLSFDAWGFGERFTRSESEIFKQMLWNGQVMWGMMVYDSMRAIDYLVAREDVDSERIGTLGISMGGTMAWWLAALDVRIGFCVDLCSLADYDALIEARKLDLHGIYYYVPSLLKYFTVGQINGLISPRPHLTMAGEWDPLVPFAGLEKINRETEKAYAADAATDAWRLFVDNSGHEETPLMRAEIEAFLLKQKSVSTK
jgi:dienelactone hydrolase